jgi:AcrR family transcriptional regulator
VPKIVDREQYRKQLLKQSFQLFAEIGYGKITMRQLAEKLEISTGTLYHYFPSKEAMFLQLVEEQLQQDIANFLSQTELVPTDTRSRVRAILEFTEQNRDYFSSQLIIWMDYYQHQGVDNERVSSIFEQLDRKTIAAINNYLQVDNYAIGEFILTFINGLLLCQLCQQSPSGWDAQVKILVEAVALMSDSPGERLLRR